MKDRDQVAEELRRVREEVRERGLHEVRENPLPAPLPARTPEPMPAAPAAPAEAPPPRPDNRALNEGWRLGRTLEGGGLRRRLARGLGRLLGHVLDTQESFNSRQVQFDNELLAYIDARLDSTHRHYDVVLGIHSRHMGEIDRRHLILQEELVAHVHDLVKRIDLVLAEAEKGRLSLEFALQDLRARLGRLEERLTAPRE
jgi:hypothetical protein